MPAVTRFEANYADEFDVSGVIVWDDIDEAREYIEEAWDGLSDSEYSGEKGFWFGSNEFLEFDDRAHYDSSWQVEEITEAEVAAFRKIMKGSAFGMMP